MTFVLLHMQGFIQCVGGKLPPQTLQLPSQTNDLNKDDLHDILYSVQKTKQKRFNSSSPLHFASYSYIDLASALCAGGSTSPSHTLTFTVAITPHGL